MHWYLFSLSYVRGFELFLTQYMVLDSFFKTSTLISPTSPRISHHERPQHLSSTYDVPLPNWGQRDTKGKVEIVEVRNHLFHEAKYGGAPIGFAHPKTSGNL